MARLVFRVRGTSHFEAPDMRLTFLDVDGELDPAVVRGVTLELRMPGGARAKVQVKMVTGHSVSIAAPGLEAPPHTEAWLDDGSPEPVAPLPAAPPAPLAETQGHPSTRDEIAQLAPHRALTLEAIFSHPHYVTAPCPSCGVVRARPVTSLPVPCGACYPFLTIDGTRCVAVDPAHVEPGISAFTLPLAVLPESFRLPAFCAICGAPPSRTLPVGPYVSGSGTGASDPLPLALDFGFRHSAGYRMAHPGQASWYEAAAAALRSPGGAGPAGSGGESRSFPVCLTHDARSLAVAIFGETLMLQAYGYFGATVGALRAAGALA